MTLIELMIAIALSMIVISLFSTLLLTARHQQIVQATLNELQENARTAFHILTTEISMAGYIGCPALSNDFPLLNHTTAPFTPQTSLSGTDNSFTVQHTEMPASTALSTSPEIQVMSDVNYKPRDIMLITDCLHAEIFVVASIASHGDIQTLRPVTALQNNYDSLAEVGRLASNTYFIENNYLVKKDIHGQKQFLVAGIKRMQIIYSAQIGDEIVEVHHTHGEKVTSIRGVSVCLWLYTNKLEKQQCLFVRPKA